MPRKRKGIPIDGWLAVDKPVGIGSTTVVSILRRLTNAAKIGHGGTLDPLASGILPIALGEATKTVSYVMDGAKTYRVVVAWGEARSTEDREGEVIATSPVRPDRDAISAALPAFTGDILQVPPAFSAIKVAGERAYDLARAGAAVELAPRLVRIDRIALLAMPDADHAEFEVECGKGTYIRSLARDLAVALGTVGHVAALRRTACGPFDESSAISLDKLQELGQGPALRTHLLPIETALDDIPALALTEAEARRLMSGQALPLAGLAGREAPTPPPGTNVRAMQGARLVALARIDGGTLRPVRVILQPSSSGEDDVDYARA
ncbi:tRNA pseudouridine(55) synthase TruB [Magnetospirillum sp. UT-4]|uniref:tRNA pseudouridine(55) synthase TruB n=1 Tax=Magnetospirillum sp. UT-4 TaxID=2681467 RepID=UPI00137E2C80|nr:tRNA pseudouridine(55) synthase TruB [Magnetospirillum sp. UT-4]CAA7617130.1 tRNA pseudouridine synthase B [Magnetospirillum sp. UT-4]